MDRKMAAISSFMEAIAKRRTAEPETAEWAAAESKVQECRWTLTSLGVSEAEIAELARG